MASVAYVALGSNLQSPITQVQRGFHALGSLADTRLLRRSSLYQSAPWGLSGQPDFINAVAELETSLDAHALLTALQSIEHNHGRNRSGPRWGPRTLDLDLLLFDDLVLDTNDLQLPHPRMHERAFVLLPLAELAPELHIPGHGPLAELAVALDTAACRRLRSTCDSELTE